MKAKPQPPVSIVKRLSEAVGYLELGMTPQAHASLDHIVSPGPFTAAVETLRAEVARREHRFEEAASSLETAARMTPNPQDRPLWLTLSAWHRQEGNTDLAIESLAYARGARPPKARPKTG